MRILSNTRITLDTPVPVYDLSVPGTENFKLAAGVFVHNSKDIADAVCGAYSNMLERRSTWVMGNTDDIGEEAARFDEERYDAPRV